MAEPFIYDSHYQVDKPLAFLDLTIETALPASSSSDDALARRLTAGAKRHPVRADGQLAGWKANDDQMRYWIGNCHSTELLSRQNAYDYWLMNFVWASAFSKTRNYWGEVDARRSGVVMLLLLRWAWIFDAPLIMGIAKKIQEIGQCDVGALVSKDANANYVEEIFAAAFAALREISTNVRERTTYRAKRDEIAKGFKYNTRRHKVCTHFSLLAESGLMVEVGGAKELHPGLAKLLQRFGSVDEVVTATMRQGSLGRGTPLYLELIERVFGHKGEVIEEIDDGYWAARLPEISRYWAQIVKWDRKFLGIRALAELFVVDSLLAGKPVATPASWQTYLSRRASVAPEELTVHVDRFGRIEFLKLNESS
jgi:hypothetical protein